MFRAIKLAKFQSVIETALNLMHATMNDMGKSATQAYLDQKVDPFEALGQLLFTSFLKIHRFQGAGEAKQFAHLACDAMEASLAMAKTTLQQQVLGKYMQLLLDYSNGFENERMQQMLSDKGLHPELPFSWRTGYAPWRI